MNEPIRQLAEQAGIEFTYDPTEVPMRAFIEAWEGDLEKFAELIMRETFNWVVDNVGLMEETEWHSLKKHFGVEE
jgi:hypothetical protein